MTPFYNFTHRTKKNVLPPVAFTISGVHRKENLMFYDTKSSHAKQNCNSQSTQRFYKHDSSLQYFFTALNQHLMFGITIFIYSDVKSFFADVLNYVTFTALSI